MLKVAQWVASLVRVLHEGIAGSEECLDINARLRVGLSSGGNDDDSEMEET